MDSYILAIDQGTTGTTVILFDTSCKMIARSYQEIKQYYPEPGWVEHDPEEIWRSVTVAIADTIAEAGIEARQIIALGITNQRETTLLWNKDTGKPYCRAIVWQCRRTTPICEQLKKMGLANDVSQRTGLIIDPYFSGTKLQWILDHNDTARSDANQGKALFGTVDSWLIWKLTGGQVHATDYSNASRTMLMNLRGEWDDGLLKCLRIPKSVLPELRDSIGCFGKTVQNGAIPAGIPICGVAGDQQAALFGQNCFEPGTAKNTYGTGCFILMNTGEKPVASSKLLSTVAWGRNGKLTYALEGSVFTAGAAIKWLRDGLRIITSAADSEFIAKEVPDSGGVYFVPAFVGLGAPYWDADARGTIVGITQGTDYRHIIRSALEAIAYQSRDVFDVMVADSGVPLKHLRVDGGASANNFLMQFQADILDIVVERPALVETTAQGAAFMAGMGAGVFKDYKDIVAGWHSDRIFSPRMNSHEREKLYADWHAAVARVLSSQSSWGI
ncbi:MAG TPA: glycerol kinase [Firmicutes bacterium]|jgi:glycerol kinase|nr:glycerol kinase [Bacillota bacterium]HAZ21645.1 glycerol kinase [Bacillota bacterium]HBE05321.1 glycerol kinase [Bacillota bacterium]HBG43338.1 glycerol kinase [Bacillota bacterium]HBL48671.1 glycerol kinase [Bacillota bacterium]